MDKLINIKFRLKLIQNIKQTNKKKYFNIINQIKKEILNLNITTNEDKIKLLNFLLEYNFDNNFINEIKTIYNINFIYYNEQYDNNIHDYLYYKIYYNFNQHEQFIQSINDRIKTYNNNKIENEITNINNFIDKYDFLNIIKNEKIIYFIDNEEYILDDYNKIYEKKINITKKIQYPFTLTKYYDNETINVYQCWIKSAINFFINNSNFFKQFINYNKNNLNNNIDSNIIESEIIKGGNNNEIYKLFIQMFIDNYNNNNIENYYILIKRLLNEKLNNKYYLGIPGYKLYPFYVIQDILILLNDQFTNNCIIKYNYKYAYKENFKSYIYDCNTNYILNDIILLYNDQIKNEKLNISELDYENLKMYKEEDLFYNNYDEYKYSLEDNKLSTLKFKKYNNKYYYNDDINNYIKDNILNTPINLLIACPIHDITSLYLLNNKINLPKYDYNIIHNYMNELYNMYDIKIKYPYYIPLNGKQYYLHSFIILINNYSIINELKKYYKNTKLIDSHFVYYKVDYIDKENNIIDLLRFDTFKSRLNKNIINTLPNNLYFIKDEFNNLYNNNCIIDNLNYKVVFCYYRRIN